MKIVKLFEEFLNELEFKDKVEYAEYLKTHKVRKGTKITFAEEEPAKEVPLKEFKCYHTSRTEIKSLSARPMWFTKSMKYAMAYHSNAIEEGMEAFTYQIQIKGNILGLEEAAAYAEEAGIDHEETVIALTEQPTVDDIKKLIAPYSKICDGFDHWDYDPIDWGDAESTIIFNPSKVATIVKQIK